MLSVVNPAKPALNVNTVNVCFFCLLKKKTMFFFHMLIIKHEGCFHRSPFLIFHLCFATVEQVLYLCVCVEA